MRKTSEIEFEMSQKDKYQKLYFHYDIKFLREKLQPALLEILIDFDKICNENGIYYVITAGTLLGAVREKGFIAWDDDIDILVRPDGMKHLKNAIKKSGMDNRYEFLLPEDSLEITIDGKFMSKTVSLGMLAGDGSIGHKLYIDVLPIENVPDGKIECNVKSFLSKIMILSYNSMRCLKKNDELLNIMAKDNKELKNNLVIRRIVAFPANILGKKKMLQLMKKINKCNNNSSKYISIPFGVKMYKGEMLPRHMFTDVVNLEFANHIFHAPQGYVGYLLNRYGRDFMVPTPKNKQGIKCFARRENWKFIYNGELSSETFD